MTSMPVMDKLGDRGRGHADPEFVVLDLLGNADEHGPASESALKTDPRRLSQEIRPAGHLLWLPRVPLV